MILPKPQDAYHKVQLYRLLIHLVDDSFLAQNLYFKGGTAAAMLNWLDRFSVDLDFDIHSETDIKGIQAALKTIFNKLDFQIKDQSRKALQFFLKYKAKEGQRNTLRLDILPMASVKNRYQPLYLTEIDRYVYCQAKETMVANKLIALTDRFKEHKTIAGRDLYDIHYFLTQGFNYQAAVIEDRTGLKLDEYFQQLIEFIQKKVTQRVIDQDLNFLLLPSRFKQIRKTLKVETLMLLKDEARRLGRN